MALVAFALFAAPTAQAAQVDASWILDAGGLTIGPGSFPLPIDGTAGIQGTYDDVTGDFEGDLVLPPAQITQTVTAPLPGVVTINTSWTSDPLTGNIDPATGEVALSTVLSLSLEFVSIALDANPTVPVPIGVTCTLDDISLSLDSQPNGTDYDPVPVHPDQEEGTFEVVATDFTVPLPNCTGNAAFLDTVRQGLIDQLVLPQSDTEVVMGFVSGEIEPPAPLPTTTAPPATAPAAATQPAAVTTGSPTFTG